MSVAPPKPPPLPAPRPLQRARDAASRFLGYSSRSSSPQGRIEDRISNGSSRPTRSSSLGTSNATTSHRTGLEIRTISINDSGSHAIIAGKEIFKTVRVEDGHCAEDFNLRTAIRSTPTHASGQLRQVYSIDIADVAWAKGDSGNFVAAATSSGKIIVYDLGHAGLQSAQLHEHFRQVHNITFNPHKGSLLLSGSQDGTVRLWDIRDVKGAASTIQSKRKFSGQSEGVRDVKWSPTEGVDFAFATDNGEIQRWDIRNLRVAKVRVPAHGLACNTVDWHPDGKHILSASSDKTVRVFDVSTSRAKKVSWEIRTPYPVILARWRPSCQSAIPQDNGAQLCAQIVTAYDREHPIMHVWDLRRPLLPFRELQPYASSPTDLLWHSQDLLWTVGREGTFMQTDIQHTSKTIDRCNLQAMGISPLGELSIASQSRFRRRVPKVAQVPFLHPTGDGNLSRSPGTTFLSRSWADDGLDQSFLGLMPSKIHHSRSPSGSRVHGASGSSTINHNQSATIKLDDIMHSRRFFAPQQTTCRGQLSSHNDTDALAFMAEHCSVEIQPASSDDEFLLNVEKTFKLNQDCTQSIGFLQTLKTWKIVGFCTLSHLKDRVAFKRKRISGKQPSLPTGGAIKTSIETMAARLAAQHLKSATHSPGTMRPVSTIANQLAKPESTSDVPTPLVRPSTDSKHALDNQHRGLPDLDKSDAIALPPSLTSAPTSPPPANPPSRRLTVGNLEDLQRLESIKEILSRNDRVKRWNTQSKTPLSVDPVDAGGIKIPLVKLESHRSGESFQFLEDSTGSRASSFPDSLESSRSGALEMVAEHPTRMNRSRQMPSMYPAADDQEAPSAMQQTMFFEGSGSLANSAFAMLESSGNPTTETSTEDLASAAEMISETRDFLLKPAAALQASERLMDDVSNHVNGQEAPLEEVGPEANNASAKQAHPEPRHQISNQAIDNIFSHSDLFSPADSVVDDTETDLELNKPWTLIDMLRQTIHHYTSEQPYPQVASFLLLLLGPLLPRTHPLSAPEIRATISGYVDHFLTSLSWDVDDLPSLIPQCFEHLFKAGLQPLQVEGVLSAYHEQLLSHRLFSEAVALRNLAYPAYPAVYEDFLAQNSVRIVSGGRGRRMNPRDLSSTSPSSPASYALESACPVCWEIRSPFSAVGDASAGERLFSSCLLCGHTGHAACLQEWFVVCQGAACPSQGCLCDCVRGAWRDEKLAGIEREARIMAQGRVKSDEWTVPESRAVKALVL